MDDPLLMRVAHALADGKKELKRVADPELPVRRQYA